MSKNLVKLVYCYYGAGIALGVYGVHNEVQRVTNQLYNFNATDSHAIWQTDIPDNSFAYVLTNWERLKKGYSDMFISGFRAKNFRPPYIKTLAAIKADNRIETISQEDFLEKDANLVEIYSVGNSNFDSFDGED